MGVHVPAGEVDRRRPVLRREVLEEVEVVVNGTPPDLDVAGESLTLGTPTVQQHPTRY
jgi:hypothetical protein